MLTIGPLEADSIVEIASAFTTIGWNKPAGQFERYIDECRGGARAVLLARWEGSFAGYGTLVGQSDYPPFQQAATPEIVDLNVLPRLQRRGIGTRLMDELEGLAARSSRTVGIGVGLTPDYGAAQQLYARRGYVPDGRGAHAHGTPLRWGDSVVADDDLVLYLVKSLG